MDDLDPTLREGAYPLQAHLGSSLPAGEKAGRAWNCLSPMFWATARGWCMAVFTRRCWTPRWGIAGATPGDRKRRVMALTLSLTVNYLSQVKGIRLIAEATEPAAGDRPSSRPARFRRHRRADRHRDGRVSLSQARLTAFALDAPATDAVCWHIAKLKDGT
jgi:hypothetical protein